MITSTSTTEAEAKATRLNVIDMDDIEAGHNKGGTVMAVGDGDAAADDDDAGTIKHPVEGVDNNNNNNNNRDTTDDDHDNVDDDDDYVTYIRPKQIKILPPAKYKLFVVTFVGVWFAGTLRVKNSDKKF